VSQTHRGPVIITLSQYAEGDHQKNITHSPAQLKDYGCIIFDIELDTPLKLGGHNAMITPCGFAIPISYKSGFMNIPMHLFIDQ
jgi:hypothetical protein